MGEAWARPSLEAAEISVCKDRFLWSSDRKRGGGRRVPGLMGPWGALGVRLREWPLRRHEGKPQVGLLRAAGSREARTLARGSPAPGLRPA